MAETTTTMARTAPTPQEQILGIILGYWQSRALAVAADLELADLLSTEPLHVDVLARRTETDSTCLFRLMRAHARE